jgi:peptidoglycan lytic transglycosylase F
MRLFLPGRLAALAATLLASLLYGCTPEQAPPQPRVEDYRAVGELRVATRLDALSYRADESGGLASGYEHDLLMALGGRLGVPVRFQVYPDALQAMDAVLAGKAHLAAAGLSPNARLPLIWSRPLREVDYVIATRDDSPEVRGEGDLAGRTLGVRRGSPPADALEAMQHRVPGLRVRHPKAGGDPHLLEMVAKGELDLAATDRAQFALAANFFPNLAVALALPIKSGIAWGLPASGAGDLPQQVESFLAEATGNGFLARIGDRYFGHIRRLEQEDVTAFLARIRERLPNFRRHFQDAQSITGIDWRLLAALAYQESKWDPVATSPTGVRGIMMLTEETADRLAVDDRLAPRASIIGGARYFALLREQLPAEVPEPDRSWMAVAAYNLGMGHFNGARRIAASLKRDTSAWLDIKEVLPLLSRPAYAARLKSGSARGGEAVTTAENVRTYFEILSRFEAPYLAPLEPGKFKLPPLRLGTRPKPAARAAEPVPEQSGSGASGLLHLPTGDAAAN